MSGQNMTPEEYKIGVSAVWKTTAILTVITIVEVGIALVCGGFMARWLMNLLMVLMGLLKAGWIIGEIMHMRYELRTLVLSVLVPVLLLVWFIIAMLADGSYWMNIRHLWGE